MQNLFADFLPSRVSLAPPLLVARSSATDQ
jgi:hypothetical protein